MKILPPTQEGVIISRFEGRYRFLSNFEPARVEHEGELYPTVEHAYQAQKFTDPVLRKVIREASTPGKAKAIAKTWRDKCRLDWGDTKDPVMFEFMWQKYCIPQMRVNLLNTGATTMLVEGNDWGDKYWGVCNGEGLNKLGRMSELIRCLAMFEGFSGNRGALDTVNRKYYDKDIQREWILFRQGFRLAFDITYHRFLVED